MEKWKKLREKNGGNKTLGITQKKAMKRKNETEEVAQEKV